MHYVNTAYNDIIQYMQHYIYMVTWANKMKDFADTAFCHDAEIKDIPRHTQKVSSKQIHTGDAFPLAIYQEDTVHMPDKLYDIIVPYRPCICFCRHHNEIDEN